MRTLPRLMPALVLATCGGLLAAPLVPITVASAASAEPSGRSATFAVSAGSPAVTPAAPAASRRPVLRPVTPAVRTYPVGAVSSAGLLALPPAGAERVRSSYAALSAPQPAPGIAVTGVTWTGAAPEGLAMEVRSRTDGSWSAWRSLNYDAEHAPSPSSAEASNARPGTDPFVVGDVDDVQLRVSSDDGDLPEDLALSVVDPGASVPAATTSPSAPSSASTLSATADTTAEPAATVPVQTHQTTPAPTISSRAAWGADERLRDCCVVYGEVHAGYVHHTVNSNSYTRAEVPAVLRGIYAYHTQSRGWRDIGYNFLVDRFGGIWEGRYGGVSLPVVGAHTLYYNENSFAGSAIGNFDITGPPAAMIDAYARLFAWKLSLHGVRPDTRQRVAGDWFNAISGHRDAAATACPGRYLYAQLPSIISKATAYQRGFDGRDLQRSFLDDLTPDVLTLTASTGAVGYARGTGKPGFERSQPPLAGFSGKHLITAVHDVTGDRVNDLMMRTAATGETAVYPGRGDGTFDASVRSTRRWAGTDLFAGPGDVTGDSVADVVARDAATGSLTLYPGRGDGTFDAGVVAVKDLSAASHLSAAGDFNRDGENDLLVRGSQGDLRVLLGDGAGRFPTSVALSGPWSAHDIFLGGVDLTGDGWTDVAARNAATKELHVFASIGGTALSPPVATRRTPARPWALSRDLGADNRPDLVSLTVDGELVVTPTRQQNWLTSNRARSTTWPGTRDVMVVGDWDGDGYVDAMTRDEASGTMWLYPGRARGGFGARTGGWSGWATRSQLTPVGDFDGDGRPDVMARAADGRIWLYPGRGSRGFGAAVPMRSSLPNGANIVAAGLWDADGAPDVLVTTPAGTVLLYPGNGPGGLDDPITIGSGFDAYDAVIGAGTLTGDGQPDLLARSRNGRIWLVPGRRPTAQASGGGFADRRYVGAGWGGRLLG